MRNLGNIIQDLGYITKTKGLTHRRPFQNLKNSIAYSKWHATKLYI